MRSFLVLTLFAVALSGCLPALTITRRHPPDFDVGPTHRRLAVIARGEEFFVRQAEPRLQKGVAAAGPFYVITMCDPQHPCSEVDGWLMLMVPSVTWEARERPPDEQVTDKDGKTTTKTAPMPQTEVQLVCSVETRDAEGQVLRQRSCSRSGSTDATADAVGRLAMGWLDEAVDALVRDLKPYPLSEQLELEDDGFLRHAARRAASDGDLEGARRELEEQVASHPHHAALQYDLGVLCEVLGQFDQAREHYRDALAAEPGVARYQQALPAMEQRLDEQARVKGW